MWLLFLDINECELDGGNVCGTNGTCDDEINDYFCKCNYGHGGRHCERGQYLLLICSFMLDGEKLDLGWYNQKWTISHLYCRICCRRKAT